MKISKLILGAAVALSAVTVSAAELPEVTNLYLIGEAAPSGWSRDVAPELTQETPGVYTWTGHLGKGQFKFLLSRDDWDSLVATEDNLVVELDTPMAVEYGVGDNKWYNETPGDYTLTVNVNNATLTVTEAAEVVISDLYLIGDASPAGWNLGEAPHFYKADGKLVYSGYLGVGQFKLATSRDSFAALVSAKEDNCGIELGEAMAMQYCAADGEEDWKWFNGEAGAYTLTADLSNNTLTVTKFDADAIAALYLVGDAVATGWDRAEAPELTGANGVFTWEGELAAGEFKFLIDRDSWDSVVAGVPNTEMVASEYMPLMYNPDGATNDNKWVVAEAGTYKLTVSLADGTMLVEGNGSAVKGIETENAAAVYYNLQGVQVATPANGIFIKVANGKATKIVK